MRFALIVCIALGLTTPTYPVDYRTPPTPGTLWIWPTADEAVLWMRDHPRQCFKPVAVVPDGFQTEGC